MPWHVMHERVTRGAGGRRGESRPAREAQGRGGEAALRERQGAGASRSKCVRAALSGGRAGASARGPERATGIEVHARGLVPELRQARGVASSSPQARRSCAGVAPPPSTPSLASSARNPPHVRWQVFASEIPNLYAGCVPQTWKPSEGDAATDQPRYHFSPPLDRASNDPTVSPTSKGARR